MVDRVLLGFMLPKDSLEEQFQFPMTEDLQGFGQTEIGTA